MFKTILLGAVILLISACGKPKRPADVLTEQEMVHTLTELYLAEEKVNSLSLPYDSLKKLFPRFSEKAFEKAGVTDSIFRKSMEYYMANPTKLENIYTALVDSLNLKAQRIDLEKKKDAAAE